jgi:hypothetical protein
MAACILKDAFRNALVSRTSPDAVAVLAAGCQQGAHSLPLATTGRPDHWSAHCPYQHRRVCSRSWLPIPVNAEPTCIKPPRSPVTACIRCISCPPPGLNPDGTPVDSTEDQATSGSSGSTSGSSSGNNVSQVEDDVIKPEAQDEPQKDAPAEDDCMFGVCDGAGNCRAIGGRQWHRYWFAMSLAMRTSRWPINRL